MTADDNKALVRRFFAGMDAGNAGVLDDVCAPNYTLHVPLAPGPLDRESAKPFFQTMLDALPGVKHSIDDILAEGSKVVARLQIDGVQNGEMMGIPPSGKPVSVASINIFNMENGAIVEQWAEFDALGMMQQIGVIPSPSGS